MSTNKITYASAVSYVLKNCNLPEEIADKLMQLQASLDKKANGAKPTERQTENATLRSVIEKFLIANEGEKFTVSDLINKISELHGMANQRVSALVNALVKDEGSRVQKETDKRKTFFFVE